MKKYQAFKKNRRENRRGRNISYIILLYQYNPDKMPNQDMTRKVK